MISKSTFRIFSIRISVFIFLGLGALLLFQHFKGGIPAHYFLARKDMPLISNVWGGVTVPLFTWLMMWRMEARLFRDAATIPFPKQALAAFTGALAYGILLGISITGGLNAISSNTPWVIAVAALLFPVYRAEYFLGFVLGLTYWVGGVLPIVVGGAFLLMAFVVYAFIRTPIVLLVTRLTKGSLGT
jgi:hypothetical protein